MTVLWDKPYMNGYEALIAGRDFGLTIGVEPAPPPVRELLWSEFMNRLFAELPPLPDMGETRRPEHASHRTAE